MSYLVTGGTGLLGSHIIKKIVKEEKSASVVAFDLSPNYDQMKFLGLVSDKVHVVRGDFSFISDLVRAIKEYDVKTLVHAGYILSPQTEVDVVKAIRTNCEGTANIMEASNQLGVKRVVYVSSQAVYGPPAIYPVKPITEDSPKYPQTMYGAYKVLDEYTAMQYHKKFGLDVVVGRICGIVYGPGKNRRGLGGLLDPIVENPIRGQPVVFPYGDLVDHFIHAADIADAFYQTCIVENLEQRIINIGGGESNSIEEFAKCISDSIPGANIKLGAEQWPAPSTTEINFDRVKKILAWSPRYGLCEGIREWVKFIQKYVF
jgi:UDP-glucose 4-epimerase